jgi:hypothetical protein
MRLSSRYFRFMTVTLLYVWRIPGKHLAVLKEPDTGIIGFNAMLIISRPIFDQVMDKKQSFRLERV